MPRKYFVMIDGHQQGPYSLEDLPSAGVGPKTYIWCKGMTDWRQAGELPDVCRLFRNRLFDLEHPEPVRQPEKEKQAEVSDDYGENVPVRFRRWLSDTDMASFKNAPEEDEKINEPPGFLLFQAVLAFLIFPPFGLVALILSAKSQKCRKTAESYSKSKSGAGMVTPDRSDSARHDDVKSLMKDAHNYARQAKMWIGFSVCVGLMVAATIVYRLS